MVPLQTNKDSVIKSTFCPGGVSVVSDPEERKPEFVHSHLRRDEIAGKINDLSLHETLALMEQLDCDMRLFDNVCKFYNSSYNR